MKKIMVIMALLLSITLFTGCGETTADGASVSVDCGAGGCGDVTIGDGNTQTTINSATPSVAFDLDNYDETLSPAECNDLGFFYCTVEQKCLPQPIDSGSCPDHNDTN